MKQNIPFESARRAASNNVIFRDGTRWKTNRHGKYHFQLFFPMMLINRFYLVIRIFSLMQYMNIPFDRARQTVSGTQHFVVGTRDWTNRFEKNSNPFLTSLT